MPVSRVRPLATIRSAVVADDEELATIDYETWSPTHTPATLWAKDKPFFTEDCTPDRVLVAEVDGAAAGYIRIDPFLSLPVAAHVLQINGFAVGPTWQRRGLASELVSAAITRARALGARKVTLRVLGTNLAATTVYRNAGFVEEGRLTDLFLLNGQYVDDVIMSLNLS